MLANDLRLPNSGIGTFACLQILIQMSLFVIPVEKQGLNWVNRD